MTSKRRSIGRRQKKKSSRSSVGSKSESSGYDTPSPSTSTRSVQQSVNGSSENLPPQVPSPATATVTTPRRLCTPPQSVNDSSPGLSQVPAPSASVATSQRLSTSPQGSTSSLACLTLTSVQSTLPAKAAKNISLLKDRTNIAIPQNPKSVPTKCGRFFCKPSTHSDLCTSWSIIEEYLKLLLPEQWCAHANPDGCSLDIVQKSLRAPISIIKCVSVQKSGNLNIYVHGKELPPSNAFFGRLMEKEELPQVSRENAAEICDKLLGVVKVLAGFDVCCGADSELYKPYYSTVEGGQVGDWHFNTPGKMTIRAATCSWLVAKPAKKCKDCIKLTHALNKRLHRRSKYEGTHPNTPNNNLSLEELRVKVASLSKQLKLSRQTVRRLRERVRKALDSDGVEVDGGLHRELTATLRGQTLSDVQQIFLEEQVKASKVKKSSGVKWHPVMLRLALYLHSFSPACYRALQDTGIIKLPSTRTLYDYTHVADRVQGVSKAGLDAAQAEVDSRQHDYQKYYVLMFDEMKISSNIVTKKSTGEIIGFVKLNKVEEEMRNLELDMGRDEPSPPPAEPTLAEQVMCFMIKGCSNSYKDVVAVYGTSHSNSDQLYTTVWHVVGCLEKVGVKVLALVCDGHPVNRGFFNKHVPVTKVASGVVFDTLNLYDPSRVMYFFSDLPHLLKSVRNNLATSGRTKKGKDGKDKMDRLLRKNNQFILWRTIVELYKTEKKNPLRKLFKLNAQNIYLNSYSTMKVAYAAQVLSRSVANCLSSRGWPGTSETVHFLCQFNDWFDMQNGAYRHHGNRKKNPLLNAYEEIDDERFTKLESFLAYLNDWELDANEFAQEKGLNAEAAASLILHRRTLVGIETTTRAFIGATRFLLQEGQKYVNGRIFCQDPLEQFFSRQRASHGGSKNPNLDQFMRVVELARTVRGLGFKRKTANTEFLDDNLHVETLSTPLPKRKRKIF
ncbi:hypothetical protein FOCC_FOCC016093 [Frankliniella occidentalis]|nr:hypothetical protein FOCC_FOCC016093 [Frankliniella occidentalis]